MSDPSKEVSARPQATQPKHSYGLWRRVFLSFVALACGLTILAVILQGAKETGQLAGSRIPTASRLQEGGVGKISNELPLGAKHGGVKYAETKGDNGIVQPHDLLGPLVDAKGLAILGQNVQLKAVWDAGPLQAWQAYGPLRVYTSLKTSKMVAATFDLKDGRRMYLVPVDVTLGKLTWDETPDKFERIAKTLKDGGVVDISTEEDGFRGWIGPRK